MPSINKRSLFVLIAFVALAVAATTAAANWAPGWSFGFFAPTSESASSTAAPIAGVPPQGTTAPAIRADESVAPLAVLLSWNTFGNLGTETTEPSLANDPNLSPSNLTLGACVTSAANGNRFGGTAWFDAGDTNPTTLAESIAGNDYIEFIVTPNAGTTFTPTSLDFVWDRSGTGPPNVTLRSSADGFAADLGTITGIVAGAFATNTITISGLANRS